MQALAAPYAKVCHPSGNDDVGTCSFATPQGALRAIAKSGDYVLHGRIVVPSGDVEARRTWPPARRVVSSRSSMRPSA